MISYELDRQLPIEYNGVSLTFANPITVYDVITALKINNSQGLAGEEHYMEVAGVNVTLTIPSGQTEDIKEVYVKDIIPSMYKRVLWASGAVAGIINTSGIVYNPGTKTLTVPFSKDCGQTIDSIKENFQIVDAANNFVSFNDGNMTQPLHYKLYVTFPADPKIEDIPAGSDKTLMDLQKEQYTTEATLLVPKGINEALYISLDETLIPLTDNTVSPSTVTFEDFPSSEVTVFFNDLITATGEEDGLETHLYVNGILPSLNDEGHWDWLGITCENFEGATNELTLTISRDAILHKVAWSHNNINIPIEQAYHKHPTRQWQEKHNHAGAYFPRTVMQAVVDKEGNYLSDIIRDQQEDLGRLLVDNEKAMSGIGNHEKRIRDIEAMTPSTEGYQYLLDLINDNRADIDQNAADIATTDAKASTAQVEAFSANALSGKVYADVGDLNSLISTDKSTLVAAVNEALTKAEKSQQKVYDVQVKTPGSTYVSVVGSDKIAKIDLSNIEVDAYTKLEMDTILNDYVLFNDAETTYAKIAELTNYVTRTDAEALYAKKTDLALKANVADVYTKAETDSKITDAINALDSSVPTTALADGEIITSIKQENGKLSSIEKKLITIAQTQVKSATDPSKTLVDDLKKKIDHPVEAKTADSKYYVYDSKSMTMVEMPDSALTDVTVDGDSVVSDGVAKFKSASATEKGLVTLEATNPNLELTDGKLKVKSSQKYTDALTLDSDAATTIKGASITEKAMAGNVAIESATAEVKLTGETNVALVANSGDVATTATAGEIKLDASAAGKAITLNTNATDGKVKMYGKDLLWNDESLIPPFKYHAPNNPDAGIEIRESGHGSAAGKNSFAMLGNAAGEEGVSLGTGSSAAAKSSFAVAGGLASGERAIAMGKSAMGSSVANSEGAIALQGGMAGNTDAIAIGMGSQATGVYDIACGVLAKAEGGNSVAIGMQANAKGGVSYAIGNSCVTEKQFGVAIGNNAKTLAEASYAIGSSVEVNNVYEIGLGAGNVSHKTEGYPEACTAASIGIATDLAPAAKKNGLEIMSNGDIYVQNLPGYKAVDLVGTDGGWTLELTDSAAYTYDGNAIGPNDIQKRADGTPYELEAGESLKKIMTLQDTIRLMARKIEHLEELVGRLTELIP